MDSLSQIVLGAACGEAVAGRQLKNKALLWGAIGGTIPDLDTFLTPFFDQVSGLLVHRGYTHSMFFAFVLAPLLAALLFRFNKKAPYMTWFWLFFFSLITHPFLDCFTGYGTPLFLPFSDYRVDINSIFIIDPVYTLIYIFCLIKVMRARGNMELRQKWNWRGIVFSTAYLLFTVVNQGYHNNCFKAALKEQHIPYKTSYAAPTALNQVLFYNFTVTDSGYYHGYHSWFDSQPIQFTFYPKNDHLLPTPLHQDINIQKLKYFSKGYYCFLQEEGKLYFCDIRFGKIGGFNGEPSPWVFRWQLILKKDGTLEVKKGDWSFSRFKALKELFKRMGGN